MVTRSFFPDYVFARSNPARDSRRSVNGTLGACAPVMQDDMPPPAPRALVETLQAMTDAGGFVVRFQSFGRDQRAGHISEPFRERIASVENATGERRVKVLLEMMGGHIPVTVDRSELVRAA